MTGRERRAWRRVLRQRVLQAKLERLAAGYVLATHVGDRARQRKYALMVERLQRSARYG